MERPGAHPQKRGLIIACGAAPRGKLSKDQRQTFRLASVDWPPIVRVHEEFDAYVGGALHLASGEPLTMVCLKAGLGAYKRDLAQSDRARLVAFLQAFLLVAAGWLAGVHVRGADGDEWLAGHATPLRQWLSSPGQARLVHVDASQNGLCETLLRIITPPRLIDRLDDGEGLFLAEG